MVLVDEWILQSISFNYVKFNWCIFVCFSYLNWTRLLLLLVDVCSNICVTSIKWFLYVNQQWWWWWLGRNRSNTLQTKNPFSTRVYLTICLASWMPVCLSICLSVCLSVFFSSCDRLLMRTVSIWLVLTFAPVRCYSILPSSSSLHAIIHIDVTL
jgi:hypothetical protein